MIRPKYWSETTLFDRLRSVFGIEKPGAVRWNDGDEWKTAARKDHPFGYLITESLPSALERVIEILVDPLLDVRHYVRNRFVDRMHVLPTGLAKGRYYDLDDRLVHAMMQSLCDHVEKDLAGRAMNGDEKKYVVKDGRCREAGLDHLAWEAKMDDPSLPEEERYPERAHAAREIEVIYRWWRDVRPHRVAPILASGYSAYIDRTGDLLDERVERDPDELAMYRDKYRDLEKAEEDEDEEMLVRLVKIRKSLWS